MPHTFQIEHMATSRGLDGARRGGGVVKSGWAETLAGRAAPDLGDSPMAAPPSGNGSTGSALGGVGHELIKVRNSRQEISLSLVHVSASGCTHSVIKCYPVSDNTE